MKLKFLKNLKNVLFEKTLSISSPIGRHADGFVIYVFFLVKSLGHWSVSYKHVFVLSIATR